MSFERRPFAHTVRHIARLMPGASADGWRPIESKPDALARQPLFAGLKRRELERLSVVSEELDVNAGRVLCREGALGREFFVIVEGEVEITKGGEHVRRLGPGDFFGEISLIEHSARSTTVTALTPLRFFVLSSSAFWSLLRSNPEVERRVLRKLIFENVAERQVAEAALRRQAEANAHQALHDALTGLPNRTLFWDRVHQALNLADREQHRVAVLLMDLDRFKEVNDTLGHRAGDALLVEVAKRLQNVLRATDTIARLGGDEFGMSVAVSSLDDLEPVMGRIRETLEEPVVLEELSIGIETSIGVALYPDHGEEADTLLQHADSAMYAAKEENTYYAVYEEDSAGFDPSRVTLISELRSALERRELVVHYQPKASLSTGRIESVEALVRWQHPTRGLVFPDQFIPLAQQTTLIQPLTLYVIEEAVRQCLAWQHEGIAVGVAVNLSPRNLLDSNFPQHVAELLAKHQFSPELLELEITESAMLANPFRTKVVLEELAAMGIRLSIDDFGVGYSSLAYLKGLPVNELKIDRSFVMRMIDDAGDAVIVRSTIDLGRNLGLEVVAEGVESEAIWNRLRELGCTTAQGYYLSRPVEAVTLTDWLRERAGIAREPSAA
jgi:diguanylate cyclase (GGDEF)-like protein